MLLNACNPPVNLAYPYSFVQVSEVAGRFGIDTRSLELFGIPEEDWEQYLGSRLEEFQPDLIGVTVRNTDSLVSSDYFRRPRDREYNRPFQATFAEGALSDFPPYFPVHATRRLMEKLRRITDLPVVVGGYGFSVMPERLMDFLRPDYGVRGGPDGFFERFEEVLSGRCLSEVPNLFYREGTDLRSGPLRFFGPAPRREYNEEQIRERNRFLAAQYLPISPLSRSVPLEIIRGCPHRCAYCSEPLVKGDRLQYRDREVIREEVEFLGRHGLNLIWFICSEMNSEGNRFMLELAEDMIRINEKRDNAEKVKWYGYYLLTISPEELGLLRRSGFLGGWNDIVSFDDSNLSRVGVPYRSRPQIENLLQMTVLAREELKREGKEPQTPEERLFHDPDHRATFGMDNLRNRGWSLFLGNQDTTAETIRITLEKFDRSGLGDYYDVGFISRATRVYDYLEGIDPDRDRLWSFTPEGPAETVDYLNPTFCFPRDLLARLGSPEEIESFFTLLENTYLSRHHLFQKDWNWFLNRISSPSRFGRDFRESLSRSRPPSPGDLTRLEEVREFFDYLAGDPSPERVGLLFNPTPGRKHLLNLSAWIAIRFVLSRHREELTPVLDFLNLPDSYPGGEEPSEFQVARLIYRRFDSEPRLRKTLRSELGLRRGRIENLLLEYLLYRNNLILRPDYRPFFLAEDPSGESGEEEE